MNNLTRTPFHQEEFSQITADLELGRKVLWVKFDCTPRPTVNTGCLKDFARICDLVKENRELIDFVVTQSTHPTTFNLGGDLDLFSKKIEEKDVTTLRNYAHTCIDIIDQFNNGFNSGVITIADVAGNALGGGFEFALVHNFLIAKQGVKLGFPEISFGLFPGMGAYPLFKRRVEGTSKVEQMIFTGQAVASDDLFAIGGIDKLYDNYQAPDSVVNDLINEITKKKVGVDLLIKNRHLVSPVSKELLMQITDLWVDGAFKLNSSNIRYMKRLVYFQDKL